MPGGSGGIGRLFHLICVPRIGSSSDRTRPIVVPVVARRGLLEGEDDAHRVALLTGGGAIEGQLRGELLAIGAERDALGEQVEHPGADDAVRRAGVVVGGIVGADAGDRGRIEGETLVHRDRHAARDLLIVEPALGVDEQMRARARRRGAERCRGRRRRGRRRDEGAGQAQCDGPLPHEANRSATARIVEPDTRRQGGSSLKRCVSGDPAGGPRAARSSSRQPRPRPRRVRRRTCPRRPTIRRPARDGRSRSPAVRGRARASVPQRRTSSLQRPSRTLRATRARRPTRTPRARRPARAGRRRTRSPAACAMGRSHGRRAQWASR